MRAASAIGMAVIVRLGAQALDRRAGPVVGSGSAGHCVRRCDSSAIGAHALVTPAAFHSGVFTVRAAWRHLVARLYGVLAAHTCKAEWSWRCST